jgi:hypothetical protein
VKGEVLVLFLVSVFALVLGVVGFAVTMLALVGGR